MAGAALSEEPSAPGAAEDGQLGGKVAIVTGGASGIGAVTAARFAEEGAAVVVSDVDADGAGAVTAGIEAAGGEAMAAECDVSDPAQVDAMVAAVTKRFGRLDIVDHNAAWTSFRGDTDALGVDLEVWDRVFAVNTRGALHVARAAIPAMLAGGGGAICNITSGAGTIAEVRRVAYGASKAAIGQLTRHLAVAYGRQGIRANAVAPGLILTPSAQAGLGPEQIATIEAANPTGRAGTPRDIANVVVFLCSDAASYINGQTIHVDGGQLIAGRIPPAQGSEGVPGP